VLQSICYHFYIKFGPKKMETKRAMVTISLKVPDELARRLAPLQDRLPEIIELGLRQWQDSEPTSLTPREQAEQIWATTGLIVPLDPVITQHYLVGQTRRTPIQAGGKPASQIIIEQRGQL
jgi:hypothetical protein